MSRTHRNIPENHYYRRLSTNSEIRQNKQLFADIRVEDDIPASIDKLNRMRRYIPDSWEDLPISSRFEIHQK
jgi:hypothetical protein